MLTGLFALNFSCSICIYAKIIIFPSRFYLGVIISCWPEIYTWMCKTYPVIILYHSLCEKLQKHCVSRRKWSTLIVSQHVWTSERELNMLALQNLQQRSHQSLASFPFSHITAFVLSILPRNLQSNRYVTDAYAYKAWKFASQTFVKRKQDYWLAYLCTFRTYDF